MDEVCRNLESGDKTIDVVPDDKARSDGMQSDVWAERTGHRNNEIPANPPYRAKVYNLVQLNCEEFRSFLTESGITVVKLDEHNGFCVEVETADDLAFIVSLDGEYYDEDHGEDVLPIKVRVLYESKSNSHFPLTELTRDMLQGTGAGSDGVSNFAFRNADTRTGSGVSAFSRQEMGAGDSKQQSNDAAVMLNRTKFATSEGMTSGTSSTAAPQLNFRDSNKPAAPCIFSRSSEPVPDLAFRQKGPVGDLSDMRSGTSCVSIYQSTNQHHKKVYQPPQVSGLALRKPVIKKIVDENGWTINE